MIDDKGRMALYRLPALLMTVCLLSGSPSIWAQTTSSASTIPALANLVDGPEGLPPPTPVDRLLPDKCSRVRPSSATVSRIMLHFTSAVMVKPDDPHNVQAVLDIFTTYTVSAHYLVDRDGTIFRLVPEERSAFHAGKGRLAGPPFLENQLNDHSIGIEIMAMGSARDMRPFIKPDRHKQMMESNPEWFGYTEAQYAALRSLLADLLRRYPEVAPDRMHIVGHDEYAPDRKTDPGELFEYSKLGLPAKPPAEWVQAPPAAPSTQP